jgi:hypothetical protein
MDEAVEALLTSWFHGPDWLKTEDTAWNNLIIEKATAALSAADAARAVGDEEVVKALRDIGEINAGFSWARIIPALRTSGMKVVRA